MKQRIRDRKEVYYIFPTASRTSVNDSVRSWDVISEWSQPYSNSLAESRSCQDATFYTHFLQFLFIHYTNIRLPLFKSLGVHTTVIKVTNHISLQMVPM